MIFLLYNVLIFVTSPIWALWMWLRTRKRNEAPNWRERLGNYEIPRKGDRKRIWVHAVSVGEVIAARPILSEVRAQLPDYEIVLTCTTSTGHSVARGLVGKTIDYLFYFPIDVPRVCMNALTRVEPAVVAIMETELWFNFLYVAKSIRCKTCVLNGRISEKSFARSRWATFFYGAIFRNIDAALMQTEDDAERARYFGAAAVRVLGNSKYDESGDNAQTTDWRQELQLFENEPLIVCGSIRGAEEARFVLEALSGIGARIVFAPRHIEAAAEILEIAKNLGFTTGLRSKAENSAGFLILDTFGELGGIYPFADIAIIGGGFSDLGGQNIIQPMAAGCPVICGPNMRNFREPFESGKSAGALKVARTPLELRESVEALLRDEQLRQRMGAAGRELVASNQGASKRYADEIARLAREFEFAWQK